MPRHPPCALTNKHTKHKKQKKNHTTHTPPLKAAACVSMLASTIQFSHNTPHTHEPAHQQRQTSRTAQGHIIRETMPQTPNNAPTHPHLFLSCTPTQCQQPACVSPVCLHPITTSVAAPHTGTQPPHHNHTTRNRADDHHGFYLKLLRKEVIQPHLPVRLPCYDFVPIADPTFDSSLTSLSHWLRVLPTFMT